MSALKPKAPAPGAGPKIPSAVADPAPADPASLATTQVDFDFTTYDPAEVTQYMVKAGWTQADVDTLLSTSALRWCNRDPRVFDKKKHMGWEPVKGPILQGDLVLCAMPLEVNNRLRAQLAEITRRRQVGAFSQFEDDASKVNAQNSGHFETFTGDKSLRDGMG